MANISSYPNKAPKLGDIMIFSETYDVNAASPVVGNPTKSTSISGIGAAIAPQIVEGTSSSMSMFSAPNVVSNAAPVIMVQEQDGTNTLTIGLSDEQTVLFEANAEFQAGVKDATGALGTPGQFLASTGSTAVWTSDLNTTGSAVIGNDVTVGNDITVTGNTVLSTARITSTLADASSSVGTSGQVLSSTATGTAWIDPETQAFSSLTTTGTTGAATLTEGVLNIPAYASSALPYASMFVRITQSGSNQPSYSVLSNTTEASITGISSGNGKYTLNLASGTYPNPGDAMVVTGGYRSARSSNSEMTGYYASQQIIITTGWWDYNGGTQASFVREDLGYGGAESLIFEFRVFA